MTATDVRVLLDELRGAGVQLWVQEGRLLYRPVGAVPPERLAILTRHKTAIIDELTGVAAAQGPPAPPAPGPLAAGPRPSVLPMSYGQESLWFLDQLGLLGPAYLVTTTVRIDGDLDETALRRAADELVRRHEVLRTRFAAVDGKGAQVVMPAAPARWDLADLSHLPAQEAERQGLALARSHGTISFDLASESAFALQVVRLRPGAHLLSVNVHHIVIDAPSLAVVFRELGALYQAFAAGEPSPLPELPAQYADYALWQRGRLKQGLADAQLAYWRQRLAGMPESLDLPFDHLRPAVPDYAGRTHRFRLPSELVTPLRTLARRHDTTLFTVLLAAFVTVLARWSGQRDICVGVPVDSRGHADAEQLAGYFLNPVVLRAELREPMAFSALVDQVRQRLIEAYDHRDLPFDQLVAALRPERELSRQPLFQVSFTSEGQGPPPRLADLDVRYVAVADDATAKFDITMFAGEGPGEIRCALEYATSLFEPQTIERMAGHLVTLLEGAVSGPATAVGALPLLTAEERRELREWNSTASPYRQDLCLHQLVEAQVRRTPEATAVVCGERSLTYDELNRQANRLARRLRELGAGADQLVGICTDRSIEMVVAIIAVLKAGAAYLPLDPAFPRARLAYMLSDSGARVIVTQSGLAGRLGDHQAAVVCLDTDARALDSVPDTDLECVSRPESLVWCIYTSGSTGWPKGVTVEHRNAVAFVHWSTRTFSRQDLRWVLLCSSLNYDPSAFELFSPLAVGGAVVVADDVLALCDQWSGPVPTLLSTVPSAGIALAEAAAIAPKVRVIAFGGEPLPREVVDRVCTAAPRTRVYNIYGPTETTIVVTTGLVGPDRPVTIGRPLTNTRIHILDASLAPVPAGVPGEMYLAGAGVARGYRNAPALTAQRFLPDPFGAPGSRMYRSGDLGRYRPDGTIEFLGRADHQVKVRGYRIELGEVESALLRCDGVAAAAVTVRDDAPGGPALVAYLTGAKEAVAPDVLRAALRRTLPEFMVPSSFVVLDALPATANGKLDRRTLPPPAAAGAVRREPAAPRTPAEQALAALWREVLDVPDVGVDDNFFRLGGHSLLAVRLVVRAREALGADIALSDFLADPSVAAMARRVGAHSAAGAGSAAAAGSADPFSVLLPLRTGPRAPLFCVHPVIGLSWCYAGLAQQFPAGTAVVGLQARGLAGSPPLPASVEAMAGDYVAQLRAVQPSGPYQLLGWSFGGIVAHAMATLMQDDGDEVSLLALVDAYVAPRAPMADRPPRTRGYARALVHRHLAGDEAGLGAARLAAIERVCAHNMALGASFRPRVFQGDVLFFASREDEDRPGHLLPGVWATHVTGRIDVHDIPHGHYDLMGAESVPTIGRVVARHLLPAEALADAT